MRRWFLIALIFGASGVRASAQLRNLDEGYPVQVEDAEPMQYGILQGHGYFRYARFKDGTDEFRIDPGVQIGFARGWQAALSVPVIWGTILQTTGGDLLASALYNFLSERRSAPALTLAGFVDIPMYNAPQSADIRLKFIASRSLGSARSTRMHLNATLGFLARPGINERMYRFIGSVGVSRELGERMSFVADLAHEEERVAAVTSSFIEAGIRRAVGRFSTVGLGAGFGIGGQSLAFRVQTGVQVWICDIVCPPGALP